MIDFLLLFRSQEKINKTYLQMFINLVRLILC